MFARALRDRASRTLRRNHPTTTECGRIAEETSRVFSKHAPSRWSTSSNSSPSSVSEKVLSSQPAASDPSHGGNKLVSWYLSILDKRPILTKSVTTCGIFGLADLTSQGITMERADESDTRTLIQRFDFNRTARMALAGLVLNGPTLHLWFNFMSRILPKADFVSSVKKMLLGQIIYGPSFNSAFFSFNGALQGESQSEIIGRLKRDLLPTLRNGIFFWPVCDVLNFKFVPVHLQGVGPHMVSDLSHMKVNPFILQQRRHYVQLRTNLEVADNSGAKRVQCIKVLKGAKSNAAGLGDIIIASVKEALPRGKVKKGEVVTCVVVRAGVHCTRSDGSQIRFDDNAAVIINKSGEPLGTRVFGPVPHELREKKMLKILALAQHVT